MKFPQEHERLMELIGLLRDGGLDQDLTTELEAILENDPVALAYYVESVDVISMLHRQQGLVLDHDRLDHEDGLTHVVLVQRISFSAMAWLMAPCASLMVGVFLGSRLLPNNDVIRRDSIDASLVSGSGTPEIATLISAAGCRRETPLESRYEGQRLTSESLRLVDGVAVVHFDCDVSLTLEGPAQLDLASFDRAILQRGKVVFRGDGDLDQFTLETPFSKIQDEGTEYAVSVDLRGQVEEIHVFDGRVIRSPSGTPELQPVQ